MGYGGVASANTNLQFVTGAASTTQKPGYITPSDHMMILLAQHARLVAKLGKEKRYLYRTKSDF
jgi:hypothetical protein